MMNYTFLEMCRVSNLTSWIYRIKIYEPYQPHVPNLIWRTTGKQANKNYDVALNSVRITAVIKEAESHERLERRDFEVSLKNWSDGGQAEIKSTVLCWIVPHLLYDKYYFYLQFFSSGYIEYVEIVCITQGKDSRMSYTACCVFRIRSVRLEGEIIE